MPDASVELLVVRDDVLIVVEGVLVVVVVVVAVVERDKGLVVAMIELDVAEIVPSDG
jgi:hypothetical protein